MKEALYGNKNKKKVLIISQYFPPDISGGGTRAYNYARCLSQQNYDVTVITAPPHLHLPIPKEYRLKLVKKEKMHNFSVIRVKIPSLLHNSAKNRIILHLSFIFSSLFPMFSLKPQIIFASEPNLFSIIPAFLYSKLRGGYVIRVVDDLWPEVMYERGYVKSKTIKKILDKLAHFSYTYPKIILPLTQEAKNHIQKNYEIEEKKIQVLEHGVDINKFSINKKKPNKEFKLMYSGSLVESYNFDLILRAAEKLKETNVVFILRGKGLLLPYLTEQKKLLMLDNLILDTELVEEDKLKEKFSQVDVFLIPLKNEYTINLSLPTKILEYEAMGRPIICCSNGAPAKFVEKTKAGLSVKCDDLTAFLDSVKKLQSNPKLCRDLGQNGRKFIEDNLTFEKIGLRLSNIITSILNNPPYKK